MNEKSDSRPALSDCCESNVVHEGVIQGVQAELLPRSLRAEMADFYKIMGDFTRISILNALSSAELCVCDIACLLDMSQSAISHQLKTLRQARLVRARRSGKSMYYSLNDDHVRGVIELVRVHLEEV